LIGAGPVILLASSFTTRDGTTGIAKDVGRLYSIGVQKRLRMLNQKMVIAVSWMFVNLISGSTHGSVWNCLLIILGWTVWKNVGAL
jgi:hypothetical protein